MKKYIKFLTLIGLVLTFTSCVEDETTYQANGEGPNLAGFVMKNQTIAGISSGATYNNDIIVEVKGPGFEDLQGDVSLTVEADASSTAIEGIHYSFPSSSITLSRDNNYYGKLPITMLTDGIVAPLEKAPVLNLKVSSASGNNVVGNGTMLKITFNYLCFSDLAGTYDAVMKYTAYDGTVSTITFTDTWTETSAGVYRTAEVGHWVSGELAGTGTPGMTVQDVCDEIIIDGQYLIDYYGNWVDDLGVHGEYDPTAGTISVKYSICYPAGDSNCRYYDVVYTKQ